MIIAVVLTAIAAMVALRMWKRGVWRRGKQHDDKGVQAPDPEVPPGKAFVFF